MKKIKIGQKVIIGTVNEILENTGYPAFIHNSDEEKHLMLEKVVPASFMRHMHFLLGKSGTVTDIERYNSINSDYKGEEVVRKIKITFDDPDTNSKSRQYTITTPMLSRTRASLNTIKKSGLLKMKLSNCGGLYTKDRIKLI